MWHARFLYEARPPLNNPIIIITNTLFQPHCFVLVVRSFALISAISISISPKWIHLWKWHHIVSVFFLRIYVCVWFVHMTPPKKMANSRLICREPGDYRIINMNNERVFIKMNMRENIMQWNIISNCIVFS